MLDEPYFMTNESWYYFDFKEMKYKLTNIATEEAKKSYTKFYKQLNNNKDAE